ncbi:hypothetical protein F511_34531 [Dorcoceras hygrometricum]|uniref:Retrotransposon gag domain-containing protein n=1 Tax=Dorcoceras hygrometricum TaxID=472368 RepID=A0A2Z7BLJ4_9LAMI|nr:hypothetical protein F511_34530 [Dorcoceras hygrometricum]KZV35503.1 hypothetical protein F511_34531 [Dorcoceras hygrometricum]
MTPRRRGRGRGQFEESAGQNKDRRSARSHTRVSDEEEEVGDLPPPVERMDVVIARFQRMNPPVFNGDESSEDADSWLRNVIFLFDRCQYDDELCLSLVILLLRKAAERWWRGASSTLEETGVGISWNSFCETFLLGSGSRLSAGQRKNKINMCRETINTIIQNNSMTFIGCFKEYLAGTCAWLQPELQERRLFTVCGGRSVNQVHDRNRSPSNQPALEGGGGGVRLIERRGGGGYN